MCVFVAECDPNCAQCTSAGAAKCDSGRCDARYAYASSSQTCQGERVTSPTVILQLSI